MANAPQRAADLGCEVFQVFTRSPQGGPAPKIDGDVVKKFKEEMIKWNQAECYIHAPYYINFASANEAIRKASIKVVREELERGSLIGAKYLMTHLGSAKDFERNKALKMVAIGVKEAVNGYKGSTEFLLEISAGSGNIIGDTFEELHRILEHVKTPDFMIYHKVGVCLDSAHMFASGYDIKTKDGLASTLAKIKKTIGLDKIKLVHANDSKVGLGERKDRHDHIGDGKIGIEGFKNLAKSFPELDFILETKHDKVSQDIVKLKEMRKNV
ncbi:MAG: putative endonuclease 4 [Candidatus Yanofskybacteria bacterium GW2011_GWA2_44_9]|nr:MAG: putative endonuclease 4 [Candidatus Yanofskybacteria bacterium GW2011_GWA2_44_9]